MALLPVAIAEAQAMLAPATRGDFKRTVAPALALVAPATMTEQDQTAWLATAVETLRGMPADLLDRGCQAARREVDHPSKIMKAIFKEVGASWERRKADLRNAQMLADLVEEKLRREAGTPELPPMSAAEIRALTPEFRRMGLNAGWITQEQIDAAEAESADASAIDSVAAE